MMLNIDEKKWMKKLETMDYTDKEAYLRNYREMMSDAGLDTKDPEIDRMIQEGANLWRLNWEFENKYKHLFTTVIGSE